MTEIICECGHTRKEHNDEGYCLARVQLPKKMPKICRCLNFKANKGWSK